MRIIGYFTSWGVERHGYSIARIPGDQLTHINYAFSLISPENGICILGDPQADINKIYSAGESVDGQPDDPNTFHGNFHQILKLKKKYPHLQVLASIGGWIGSSQFSDAALTEASRRKFARSCLELHFDQYPGVFDGIDIDWEFPVSGGLKPGRPEDKHNFTLLLSELRCQLDELGKSAGRHYSLTAALPAPARVHTNFELNQIHPYLDWINLMTYDFHGTWDTITNFNAPLYAVTSDPASKTDGQSLNVDAAVKAYLQAGIPADKLMVGMPFYGRGWAGVPDINHGLFQVSSGPAAGAHEPGMFNYEDIKRGYLPAYPRYWQEEAKVPWLYDPATGTMISYDDPESIAIKAEYIKELGLGGAMFWELSCDGGELLEALARRLKLPA